MKKNIVFIDMPLPDKWEFLEGLKDETTEEWEVKAYISNQGRTSFNGILRYCKYFYYSFVIFLNRNKYDKILCWQAFYGIILAFYCKLFRVKKNNIIIVKNLVYKPKVKNNMIGKIYFKWLNSIINSNYVDLYISASLTNSDFCAKAFNVAISKFIFIPFSVDDAALLNINDSKLCNSNYILALGRSNRDWEWLINSFRNTSYNLIIICDELDILNLPENVKILNNVWDDATYKYIKYCKCMIIPIKNGSIASGDTVLLRGMSFAKPIIINRPSCLADDYVINNVNGLIINKDKKELLSALDMLYSNDNLYNLLSTNARETYLTKHTIYQYGKNMGIEIKKVCYENSSCK